MRVKACVTKKFIKRRREVNGLKVIGSEKEIFDEVQKW